MSGNGRDHPTDGASGLRALPLGWAWTMLREIADIRGGLAKGQRRATGTSLREVPYLRVANVQRAYLDLSEVKTIEATEEEIAQLNLQPGDVLFNEGGDRDKLGRGWIWRVELPECIHQNHVFRARLRSPEIEPKLLSWYGNSVGQQYFWDEGKHTTNLASINLTKLGNLPVALPPAGEQRRIVSEIERLFSLLDAGVAALKRVQAKLKRYRACVLRAACEGRLVPTEAELARREERDYEPADRLLVQIADARRRTWEEKQLAKMKGLGKLPKEDSWKTRYKEPASIYCRELPGLPEGWTWVSWEQVGFYQNGRSFPSQEYRSTGVKLLRPGNLHASGRVVWTEQNTRYLPEKWLIAEAPFLVGPNELVINLTAQSLKDEFLGRVCLTGMSERCLLNQRIARLTPVLVRSRYLLWMFKSHVFRRFVNNLNTGSLIQHMFTSQLIEFCLPLPPLAEQDRIVAEVERRLSIVEGIETVIQANLKRAEGLRQSILKRAFEGRLVPQDPSDEPASHLLERIREARAEATGSNGKRRTSTVRQPALSFPAEVPS
jgi:type I restriction enzyme, S subunit